MDDTIKITGRIKLIWTNVNTGEQRVEEFSNMVTTVGKEMIAQGLVGQTGKEITYIAVGTDSTAPALGDTTLGTEIARKQISVREVTNNTATFTVYFNTSEANGSLEEFGLFGDDATATADSGVLFARALESRTKTSADTLTAVWSVAIG